MKTREITIADYENLILFWQDNYFVNDMDSKQKFQLFLEKNPSLSILIEHQNTIVGTALGSFDGRRDYIQKLVVDKAYRKKGIGTKLVEGIILRLQKVGVTYIPIAVEPELVHFYQNCGFKKTSQIAMNIEIR